MSATSLVLGGLHAPTSDRTAAQQFLWQFASAPMVYTLSPSGNGSWFRWSGVHYAEIQPATLWQDYLEPYIELYVSEAQILQKEHASSDSKPPVLKDIARYAGRLNSEQGMTALERTLRKYAGVSPDYFDGGDRDLFVLADGQVIDLAHFRQNNGEVKLLPPDSFRAVNRCSRAVYREDASQDEWLRFLESSVPNEPMRVYLQTCAGAALLGDPGAKRIPHLVGVKNTGKSTYLKAMVHLFGGYGAEIGSTALLALNGQNFARDDFRGIRFATISEPPRSRLDDAFLLSITGGEKVLTGKKGRDFTPWMPECVLHIAANQVIKFDTRAEEILSRVDVVDFPNRHQPSIGSQEKLDDRLSAVVDGILLWVLEGARTYLVDGVTVPKSIDDKRASVADEASVARRWLNEMLEEGCYSQDVSASASSCVSVSQAYTDFSVWSKNTGELSYSRLQFRRDLEAKLGPVIKSSDYKLPGIIRGTDESLTRMRALIGL